MSGVEAGGGLAEDTGCPAGCKCVDLGFFLALGLDVVGWAEAWGGGPGVGEVSARVALAVDLGVGAARASLPAATAAAKEELGGWAVDAGWVVTNEVGGHLE